MSTAGLQAANKQNAKELDNMKESISDIINQLQDIDPTRLSFSPFLDLDTQISLAPVSDSPESSVEELHSSSHSFSGSQHSLEEPPAASRTRGELLVDFHYLMEKIFKIKGVPRESSDGVRTTNLLCYFLLQHRTWNQTKNCLFCEVMVGTGFESLCFTLLSSHCSRLMQPLSGCLKKHPYLLKKQISTLNGEIT